MLILPKHSRLIPKDQPFALLDRDGLININHGYVFERQNFQLMPKVIDGLLALQSAGFQLAIVTNQSGIARGYYSEQTFQEFSYWLFDFFATHNIFFTALAYCPHHPTAGQNTYLQACDCRKPNAGMLNEVVDRFSADVNNSVMFGDKCIDVQAGINGNIPRQFLVSTETTEREKARDFHTCSIHTGFYSAVKACIAE